MASYQQQMFTFHQQVRTTSEVWLAKTYRLIAIYKTDVKSPGLDNNDKEFLRASISQLEDKVRTYKELITQTYPEKWKWRANEQV
jgi:hypothetical protein